MHRLLVLRQRGFWETVEHLPPAPRQCPGGSYRSCLGKSTVPDRGHHVRQAWEARSLFGMVMHSHVSILESSGLSELGGWPGLSCPGKEDNCLCVRSLTPSGPLRLILTEGGLPRKR